MFEDQQRELKEAAQTGGLLGRGTTGQAAGAPPVEPRLETIASVAMMNNEAAQELLQRLESLHIRLYGPTPTDSQEGVKQEQREGVLANLESRQSDITYTLRQAFDVLGQIENIA